MMFVSKPLQMLNLAQQLRRLVFQLRALDDKVLFRILARLELEVQVAQIFVELFLALQQVVKPRLLALTGEDILRPEGVDEEHIKIIPVELTKQQIENAPALETERPVSRQYELDYYSFYGWPAYWDGTEVWGNMSSPNRGSGGWSDASRKHTNDPHLRSTRDVLGHSIQALDGEIGHIEDFVVDDETWVIRYLVVDTKNWCR